MQNKEVRTLPVELRVSPVAADGFTRTLTGTAIVFNSRSENLGSFYEVIKPEAFRSVMSGTPDLPLYNNHNTTQVLARSPGTMKLTMDSRGIHYTAQIDTRQSYALDVALAVQRGDIKGNSFGFRALKDSYSDQNGKLVRSILDAELIELSCTSIPAYKSSTLNIRAACPPELRHLLGPDAEDQGEDVIFSLLEIAKRKANY